jgi:opacity protein-like surface antigen
VKNIFKVLLITAGIVLSLNVNSFALVDGAIWGGYGFSGETDLNPDADLTGYDYGIKAHYNTSLIPLIELGLGAYYQKSNVTFDVSGETDDYTRKSAGIDLNLIFSAPIIHPYLRGTYALWDDFDGDTENYKAWGAGAGVELTVFPFIRIFGEYMYETTEHFSEDIKMNSVNFGLKADI